MSKHPDDIRFEQEVAEMRRNDPPEPWPEKRFDIPSGRTPKEKPPEEPPKEPASTAGPA